MWSADDGLVMRGGIVRIPDGSEAEVTNLSCKWAHHREGDANLERLCWGQLCWVPCAGDILKGRCIKCWYGLTCHHRVTM